MEEEWHKEIRDVGYQHYENYDTIEVPFTDAIPSDDYKVIRAPLTRFAAFAILILNADK